MAKKIEKVTNKELEKLMEGKTRCTKCGHVFSTDLKFYISNSKCNTNTGRITLCKSCLEELYKGYLRETRDIRKSIYKLCRILDFIYLENIYESSYTESGVKGNEKNLINEGMEVWKKYIKSINSLKQYDGMSFEHGVQIKLEDEEDNDKKIEKVIDTSNMSEEELEKQIIYKNNKEYSIKTLGYDPFEDELEEDKPKMYANLVNMMTDDIENDAIKIGAVLDVIKTQNQVGKINTAIVGLNKDSKNIINNIGTVQSLIKAKSELNKTLTNTIKENKMVEKKSAGASTFTGKENKMKNLDLEAIQVNMYDQNTALGMQQVADMSLRATLKELNFGDDTLSEMVKEQRQIIDSFRNQYDTLREENRRLKALCHLNEIKYKDYIFNDEWAENLEFNKELEDKKIKERQDMEESIIPLSVDKYADKVIEEKKKEDMKKLKDNMENKK